MLASAIATLSVGAGDATQSTSFLVIVEVLGFIISLLVYTYLAYKQVAKTYQHAFYVAILFWLINLGSSWLMNIFLDIPIVALAFLFPFLLSVIAVLLGTVLGIQLRQKLNNDVIAI
ncbi:hypothetical protein [Thalassotalea sp. ND16A]|uniref:hypothetical protein n=1 Tax=Thalassotalea sp. ND16A TaxID=1535422 RepID=UPI001F2A2B49|nr:hypothetical protein [Thalassotalea sp. ND16A]